jgi:hypothetical protein
MKDLNVRIKIKIPKGDIHIKIDNNIQKYAIFLALAKIEMNRDPFKIRMKE